MGIAFMVLAFAFLYLLLGVSKLDELRAVREKAGAEVIALRDQSSAPDWKDDGTFEEKWTKANAAYDAAVSAEEAEVKAEETRTSRGRMADRINADAERLGLMHRGRIRPDYNPNTDPRSRGSDNTPSRDDWGRAIRTWAGVRRPEFDPSDEDVLALRRTRVNLMSDEIALPFNMGTIRAIESMQEIFIEEHPARRAGAIRRIMASWNTMTPDSAGYIAEPPQVIRSLEVNRLAFGGLLQLATVRNTVTGEDVLLPFTDDTTVKGRRIAEDGPLGTERNPKVGLIRWGAFKYTSDLIVTTFEMLRDSMFDLETFIGDRGGERLGRIQNYEATLGNGANMPRGVVFSAPVGVTTASPTAITTDEVIDLEESVDEAYQAGDRVGYMMNKGIRKYLRKLKDLQGRPFYVLGQETGGRDQLNGKPIYLNYDMDNTVAATKIPILYGDFSKVVIRRVGGTRIVRDPYTQRISNDRELFAAVEYMDSNVVNAGTAPIKKMLMHA